MFYVAHIIHVTKQNTMFYSIMLTCNRLVSTSVLHGAYYAYGIIDQMWRYLFPSTYVYLNVQTSKKNVSEFIQ